MKVSLLIGKIILNIIYCFHKLAPTSDKITIISRQDDQPTIDIALLAAELKKRDKKILLLCKTIGESKGAKIRYLMHLIGPQMHHIATSQVVVLDSYCIAVSMLRHKKNLKVLQMWHAMGALKKFGYSILDQEEGRRGTVAKAMGMHHNYDYILASSEKSAQFFGEAFGYSREHFKIIPLPRTDLLRSESFMETKKKEIYKEFPQLRKKKTILYAPTFRVETDKIHDIKSLIDTIDYDTYNLIIAPHPLMTGKFDYGRAIFARGYTTMELFPVCQYFVTDYSAVLYEAALAQKPIFLYTYDLEEYKNRRGFYIDYEKELPEQPLASPDAVMAAIENSYYNVEASIDFANKYIDRQENCTGKIADLIESLQIKETSGNDI